MRHRTTAAVAVALVALVAGVGVTAALTGGSSANRAAPADGGHTVAVTATGSVTAQPDQATVRVAAVATGPNASVVRQRLAANASALRSALAEQGVPDDRIRTESYAIEAVREERKRAPDAPAYRGLHAFEVTLTDLDAVGEVVDAAVASGASRVRGVTFGLSTETRRAVRKDALRAAMANARGQAAALAGAGNLTLVGVDDVRTAESTYRPYEYAGAAASGDATEIASGSVSVRVQVHVTYNATRA